MLEGVPAEVGKRITETVEMPTIGIGAGPDCDGQVLVINDLLGLGSEPPPKFAKAYADLRGEIAPRRDGVRRRRRGGPVPRRGALLPLSPRPPRPGPIIVG